MDPRQSDALHPWGPPKKKNKLQTISGFFKKKSEDVVQKEREANDARSEQVRLEAAQRRTAIRQKLDLLVTKWKLPPRPDLTRQR